MMNHLQMLRVINPYLMRNKMLIKFETSISCLLSVYSIIEFQELDQEESVCRKH